MFAVRTQKAPRVLGTSTPEAVVKAVLRAIQRDVGEIIVNPGPVRLGLVFEELSPGFARWLLEKAGVYDYYRRQAEEERESLRKSS